MRCYVFYSLVLYLLPDAMTISKASKLFLLSLILWTTRIICTVDFLWLVFVLLLFVKENLNALLKAIDYWFFPLRVSTFDGPLLTYIKEKLVMHYSIYHIRLNMGKIPSYLRKCSEIHPPTGESNIQNNIILYYSK